eukprot:CAMPEP_0177650408 /NCGR_PEP_ID=MMETSP0447-20121125/11925_1 /TAXON_ID=0 /ORGANISM="Stygamoeba regulata, Strain BSH-02190019" /LENGTH=222 /DNA_ID=CAMNT_0019153273 /DNA_START=161 /DNA_END=829 /DNA_ORIENTATION=+
MNPAPSAPPPHMIYDSTSSSSSASSSSSSSNADDLMTCPICLEVLDHAVETSCGHAFCGQCLIQTWESGNTSRVVLCPLDRQPVTMIIPSHLLRNIRSSSSSGLLSEQPEGGAAAGRLTSAQVDQRIRDYNEKFAAAPRDVATHLNEDVVILQQLFRRTSFGRFIIVALFAVSMIYLLIPNDLVPSSLLDDMLFWLVALLILFAVAEKYRERMLVRVLGGNP